MGKEDYVSVPLYDHEAVYPVKAPKTAAVVKKSAARSQRCCSPCTKILLGLFVVFIVVPFLLFGVVVIATYSYVTKQVKSVTVTERRVLPVVELSESELEMAQDRMKLFWDDLAADRTPANDLILTADEINGFIAASDYLRGNAFVRLAENELTLETSLPLDPAPFLPGGQGRYFVSTTVVAVKSDEDTQLAVDVDAPVSAFQGGKLVTGLFAFGMDDNNQHHVVHLLYGKAFGAEPCDKFYQEHHNILDFIHDDDDDDVDKLNRAIDNLATIKFLNNKIVFTARQPDDVPVESSTETTSRLSPWNLLRRLF